MKEIILASASLRREELLKQIGLGFRVASGDYQEETKLRLKPKELVKYLSRQKARAVAVRHPGAIIIAADTVGYLDGRILGKPETEAEAVEMLTAMSGRTHLVVTGFTIIDMEDARVLTRIVVTRVTFKRLTHKEIEGYVRSGEWVGKAGAYAIQGLGAVLVKEIHGDYFNVVGLPLSALTISLKRFGIGIL